MIYPENNKVIRLDATDWLKQKYGDDIHPDVSSVELCQSSDAVWVTVKRKKRSAFGDIIVDEISNLDIAKDPIGNSPNIADEPFDAHKPEYTIEVNAFLPSADIVQNANLLFSDKITMENITTIFD